MIITSPVVKLLVHTVMEIPMYFVLAYLQVTNGIFYELASGHIRPVVNPTYANMYGTLNQNGFNDNQGFNQNTYDSNQGYGQNMPNDNQGYGIQNQTDFNNAVDKNHASFGETEMQEAQNVQQDAVNSSETQVDSDENFDTER